MFINASIEGGGSIERNAVGAECVTLVTCLDRGSRAWHNGNMNLLLDILTEFWVKVQRPARLYDIDLTDINFEVCFELRHDGPCVYAFSPAKPIRVH